MTKKSHNQRDSKSLFSERSSLAQFLQSKAIPRSATPRNEQESSINSKQDAKVKISRAILEDKSSLLMPQNEYSNHQSNMITFKAGSLKGDQSRRTDQKENSILESPNRKLSGQNEFQTQINVKQKSNQGSKASKLSKNTDKCRNDKVNILSDLFNNSHKVSTTSNRPTMTGTFLVQNTNEKNRNEIDNFDSFIQNQTYQDPRRVQLKEQINDNSQAESRSLRPSRSRGGRGPNTLMTVGGGGSIKTGESKKESENIYKTQIEGIMAFNSEDNTIGNGQENVINLDDATHLETEQINAKRQPKHMQVTLHHQQLKQTSFKGPRNSVDCPGDYQSNSLKNGNKQFPSIASKLLQKQSLKGLKDIRSENKKYRTQQGFYQKPNQIQKNRPGSLKKGASAISSGGGFRQSSASPNSANLHSCISRRQLVYQSIKEQANAAKLQAELKKTKKKKRGHSNNIRSGDLKQTSITHRKQIEKKEIVHIQNENSIEISDKLMTDNAPNDGGIFKKIEISRESPNRPKRKITQIEKSLVDDETKEKSQSGTLLQSSVQYMMQRNNPADSHVTQGPWPFRIPVEGNNYQEQIKTEKNFDTYERSDISQTQKFEISRRENELGATYSNDPMGIHTSFNEDTTDSKLVLLDKLNPFKMNTQIRFQHERELRVIGNSKNQQSAVSDTRMPSLASQSNQNELVTGYLGCGSPSLNHPNHPGTIVVHSIHPNKLDNGELNQQRFKSFVPTPPEVKSGKRTSNDPQYIKQVIAPRYVDSILLEPSSSQISKRDQYLAADVAVGVSEEGHNSLSYDAQVESAWSNVRPLQTDGRKYSNASYGRYNISTRQSLIRGDINNQNPCFVLGNHSNEFGLLSPQSVRQYHQYQPRKSIESSEAQIPNPCLKVHKARLFNPMRTYYNPPKTQFNSKGGPRSISTKPRTTLKAQCFDYDSIVTLLNILKPGQQSFMSRGPSYSHLRGQPQMKSQPSTQQSVNSNKIQSQMRINHQELANVEPANLMINTNPKIWDNRNISLDMISRKNSDLEIKNESNDFILDTNKVSYLFSQCDIEAKKRLINSQNEIIKQMALHSANISDRGQDSRSYSALSFCARPGSQNSFTATQHSLQNLKSSILVQVRTFLQTLMNKGKNQFENEAPQIIQKVQNRINLSRLTPTELSRTKIVSKKNSVNEKSSIASKQSSMQIDGESVKIITANMSPTRTPPLMATTTQNDMKYTTRNSRSSLGYRIQQDKNKGPSICWGDTIIQIKPKQQLNKEFPDYQEAPSGQNLLKRDQLYVLFSQNQKQICEWIFNHGGNPAFGPWDSNIPPIQNTQTRCKSLKSPQQLRNKSQSQKNEEDLFSTQERAKGQIDEDLRIQDCSPGELKVTSAILDRNYDMSMQNFTNVNHSGHYQSLTQGPHGFVIEKPKKFDMKAQSQFNMFKSFKVMRGSLADSTSHYKIRNTRLEKNSTPSGHEEAQLQVDISQIKDKSYMQKIRGSVQLQSSQKMSGASDLLERRGIPGATQSDASTVKMSKKGIRKKESNQNYGPQMSPSQFRGGNATVDERQESPSPLNAISEYTPFRLEKRMISNLTNPDQGRDLMIGKQIQMITNHKPTIKHHAVVASVKSKRISNSNAQYARHDQAIQRNIKQLGGTQKLYYINSTTEEQIKKSFLDNQKGVKKKKSPSDEIEDLQQNDLGPMGLIRIRHRQSQRNNHSQLTSYSNPISSYIYNGQEQAQSKTGEYLFRAQSQLSRGEHRGETLYSMIGNYQKLGGTTSQLQNINNIINNTSKNYSQMISSRNPKKGGGLLTKISAQLTSALPTRVRNLPRSLDRQTTSLATAQNSHARKKSLAVEQLNSEYGTYRIELVEPDYIHRPEYKFDNPNNEDRKRKKAFSLLKNNIAAGPQCYYYDNPLNDSNHMTSPDIETKPMTPLLNYNRQTVDPDNNLAPKTQSSKFEMHLNSVDVQEDSRDLIGL